MATAVKWIGIGALGAIVLFLIIQKLLGKKLGIGFRHIALLFIIPLIYFVTFLPDLLMRPTTGWWQYLSWWHTSAFEYHAHLNATHPYGSNWWTWAITLRPVWMYYKSLPNGYIQGIIEVGNVVSWIGGLIALFFVIASLRTRAILKKNDAYLFLILTYAALYLPWTLISRVKFIYHYFVPLLMLLIILACVIEETFLQDKENQWFGWAFLIFAAAVFIYFLPLVMGIPITQSAYMHHLWFGKHWI
jgi:dolichyl-phosphate-mannose--protein O-mannosyl transferase